MAPKSTNREESEYRLRRERNNIAVKKSREKNRNKALETSVRAEILKQENEELERKVNTLTKELSLLKELLLSTAGRKPKPDSGDDQVAHHESIGEISSTYNMYEQMISSDEAFPCDDYLCYTES